MNNDRPFIYPANTGIAYSFTDDGYFETAQYRFQGNGALSRDWDRIGRANPAR